MNAAKQAIWLFIALIGLACSGWYFASSAPKIKLDDKTLSSTVDIVIDELTVHQFDTAGHLSNYLTTPLMRHKPLRNEHWFKTPHIIISNPNKPAWEIQAKDATSLYNGKLITFNNDVIIHQNKNDTTSESTLKTEEITYFPQNKLATTTHAITFIQAGKLIKSTGMNVYLDENRVQLLSHAEGTFEPEHG